MVFVLVISGSFLVGLDEHWLFLVWISVGLDEHLIIFGWFLMGLDKCWSFLNGPRSAWINVDHFWMILGRLG